MLKAVIFDLDGVLIDSEQFMRKAFDASYQQVIGDGHPPTEAFLEHMGEAFPAIMDQLGLPHTLWEPFAEFCKHHLEHITLFAPCRDLLAWAKAQGLKLAILTGKDHVRTRQVLQHFQLDHFFDVVLSSDQLQHSKPHPEGILSILEQLGCLNTEAVMIGDSVSDVVCAQRANVTSIAVTWGIKPERVQTLCQPDYTVHNWDMLLQVLCLLFSPNHEEAISYEKAIN